jgi:hypothetical protein
MIVEGMVGQHHERLAMINPAYELLAPSSVCGSKPA